MGSVFTKSRRSHTSGETGVQMEVDRLASFTERNPEAAFAIWTRFHNPQKYQGALEMLWTKNVEKYGLDEAGNHADPFKTYGHWLTHHIRPA